MHACRQAGEIGWQFVIWDPEPTKSATARGQFFCRTVLDEHPSRTVLSYLRVSSHYCFIPRNSSLRFYSWHTVQFPSCYQTKSLWDSSETCGQLTNAVSNCRCQLHYQLPVAQVLAPKICKLAIFVFVLVFDEAAGTCEKFGLIWRSQMLCGLPVSAINLPARSEQVKRAHVYIPGLLELALVCVIETVGYICTCCSLTLTLGDDGWHYRR